MPLADCGVTLWAEIHFYKSCCAHFISNKQCFQKRFGTYRPVSETSQTGQWWRISKVRSTVLYPKYGIFNWNFVKPYLQGTIFQITRFQTNSKVITDFKYIPHYGPVILLLCMTTSETGLYCIRLSFVMFHSKTNCWFYGSSFKGFSIFSCSLIG